MSTVRMLVLGVIRMRGEAHGYAVHRELMSWRVDTWTAVKPPSIYHAAKKLHREGLLSTVGSQAGRSGPARIAYRVTESGDREFFALLEEALRSPEIEEFGAGVAFMTCLTRDRVEELLTERLGITKQVEADLLAMRPQWPHPAQPPHAQHLLNLWSGVFRAQSTWTADLIAKLDEFEFA